MALEDFDITWSKPIGQGSIGVVFSARRISDDRPVAFKLVPAGGKWGPAALDAERKGAILQQRFASEHGMVPEVYDYGPHGDDFFIAMELIEGSTLEAVMRRGPLSPTEAVEHALWLSTFLEKAHAFSEVVDGRRHRMLHTDLKPANLMVSSSGDRRVLDFGIARMLEESRELGTDIGRTTAYASPERLQSGQVGPHADFWSLGVMLFEMVCGRRPYHQWDAERYRRELELAITTNAPRVPFPEGCPPALGAVVNKLLAFQVEHRYPSAQAIRCDLELFLKGETPTALAIYETPATTPVRRESAAAVAGVAAAPAAPPNVPPTVRREPSPATTPRPSRLIPPTEPRREPDVPATEAAPVASVEVPVDSPLDAGEASERVPMPRPTAPQRSRLKRAGRLAFTAAIVMLAATEGVALLFAERFRDTMLPVDERTVTDRRAAYNQVDGWALLDIGLKARVHRRLLPNLAAVGDRVITDYRREEPLMGPAEWTQANEALRWAIDINSSRALRARQLITAAHVKRFEAQSARGSSATLLSQAAMSLFREAANADAESYDPYLGMARIQVYALADVDAAAASIKEAEKRGYIPGRREAALLGDGYLRRATSTRRRAMVLTGEQRWRELNNARDDYHRCVTYFDPIVAFGMAAQNLETCKAQLDRIDRQLDAERQEW